MHASIRRRRIGAADPNISMLMCITSSITLCTRSPSVQESFVMKVSSNTPAAPSSRPAHSTARPLVRLLRVLLGVAALGLGLPRLASADTKPACRVTTSLHAHGLGRNDLSQDDDDTSSGKGASPEQIEKYVAVYRAMQRNHNLTIE